MLKLGSSLEAKTILKPNERLAGLARQSRLGEFLPGEHRDGKACLGLNPPSLPTLFADTVCDAGIFWGRGSRLSQILNGILDGKDPLLWIRPEVAGSWALRGWGGPAFLIPLSREVPPSRIPGWEASLTSVFSPRRMKRVITTGK